MIFILMPLSASGATKTVDLSMGQIFIQKDESKKSSLVRRVSDSQFYYTYEFTSNRIRYYIDIPDFSFDAGDSINFYLSDRIIFFCIISTE